MTEKDYIKMANKFKNAYNINKKYESMIGKVKPTEILTAIIKDFAVMLKEDNSKFNIDKWNKYIFG